MLAFMLPVFWGMALRLRVNGGLEHGWFLISARQVKDVKTKRDSGVAAQ